ncbi:hypothetical protein [Imhoffiella purpurea]|uniref:Uncharacterized protein n=1 Tax=Imhoffiella purpurea TaxID=1249627 RepID=W9V687_9GAMM|nr:hypothetical protein [Imhoffiella purpurea]EXJ15078.1 hypothetical protein D779_1632 [Imhoffiella purpurea]
MGALGVLAAAIVLAGGIQSTVHLADADDSGIGLKGTPVIEVQAIQSDQSGQSSRNGH